MGHRPTSGDLLAWAEHKLSEQGIATAHLDALVLLEDSTKLNRAQLLSETKMPISSSATNKYKRQVRLRAQHIPLAFIRGKSEFYGREFKLNSCVLEPRSESETLIEEFLRITKLNPKLSSVVDIGTGSGALIVTAKLEKPDYLAVAVDIDSKCLKVARQNAKIHHLDISFYCGDLIRPLPSSIWETNPIVLANLPYVPNDWQINRAAMHEPSIAIFGGPDGLDLYRHLFKQLSGLKQPPSWVLTESMPPQHQALAQVAKKHGYKTYSTNDFVQVFSCIN
ncbi:MAG: N5-glutamine methyltransferase family protein [Candidatus Saccharimonadales bacterium]